MDKFAFVAKACNAVGTVRDFSKWYAAERKTVRVISVLNFTSSTPCNTGIEQAMSRTAKSCAGGVSCFVDAVLYRNPVLA